MNININDQTVTISSTEINNLNVSESNVTKKIYDKNEKKIIVSRIEQIKSKKIYLKIFKIISDDGNHYVINPNGIFLNLNNVSDITLAKIERVLDLCDNYKKIANYDDTWSQLLQKKYDNQSENNDKNDETLNSHEKMILKKQQMMNDKDTVLWGSNISSFGQL
jgi:hypothetical protein